ncbi:MAG: phosphoserine transaminase [Deltaproteobacteria bacterium]|nr:phosphoserine transaminase [Deltaproteobacteria bacterium]
MGNPNFSSGPCSKRPGWNAAALHSDSLGRSHRSALGKKRLAQAIDLSRKILGMPDDYLLGITAGSDTGAFEAAMWSLLGSRPVSVLVWESFSQEWATDVETQLKLNPKILRADYGKLPDLTSIDWTNDVVFVANGTTSGVRIPDWEWIPRERGGLTLCDATSAAFAMEIDWAKVDVLTFSWQKCLGGEAAHGMLALGPRAVARIESYSPAWPLPKIFRFKKGGALNREIFRGDTINTPSMLCVEDYLDTLRWAEGIGLAGLIARSRANLAVVEEWVEATGWVDFLAETKDIRSHTSVCLKVIDEAFLAMSREDQARFIKTVADAVSAENIAHDIGSYRDAPPGFRFWCGPTIEPANLADAVAGVDRIYRAKMGTYAPGGTVRK